MSAGITLVVALFTNVGRESEFQEYEAAAARIMSRYGGKVERKIRCAPHPNQPDEVHVLTFPDAAALDRYLADAELKGLADLRARAIRETTIWVGEDLPRSES